MKGIKAIKRVCACGLAIVLFLMSSIGVLAADHTFSCLIGNEKWLDQGETITIDAQYLGHFEHVNVYVNGELVGTCAKGSTYTMPADGFAKGVEPANTSEPRELKITYTAPSSDRTESVPSSEPSNVPSSDPSGNPSSEPSSEPSGTPAAPAATPSATPGTVPTPTPIAGNGYRHTCTYDWIITLEPTMETDGILSYMCEECQGVIKTQPISRYHAILKEIEKKITSAPEGAAIEIEYDFLQSLPKWIIDLLDERSDLTVKVTFKTDNTWYTFTIPARDKEDKLAEDGMNYYGFHSLGDKYGKRELEK